MPRRKSNAQTKLDAELIRRGLVPKPTIDYHTECHAKQASLVECLVLRQARYVAVLAGRQSGKSHGAAIGTLVLGSQIENVAIVYVTSTDASVRKMAFGPARKLNTKHGLGGKPNLADRSITFPNGSTIYFIGADSERTIERLRGTPNLILCVIDECGIYDSDMLAKMIEAVTPGLRPLAGALVLMGTASLQGTQGRWYETVRGPGMAPTVGWTKHEFDYTDNDRVPSFAEAERLIDEELAALGYTRTSAYFLREYKSQFVVELSERVYQISDANYYDGEPPADLDAFVTGGDLGVSANDALLTIGWKKKDPKFVWEIEASEASGQDSLAFAAMAKDVNDRRHPIAMPVDPGGLGQKTIKTVKTLMPDIPIIEAKKPLVSIQVRSVNILAQSGRLKIRRNGKLAKELATPTWVNGIVGGEINEHGKHSDLAPCLRYAVLAATPYLPRVPADEPKLTPMQRAQAKEVAELAKMWRAKPVQVGPPDQLANLLGSRRSPADRDWR